MENLILWLGSFKLIIIVLRDYSMVHVNIFDAYAVFVWSWMCWLQVKTINRIWHLRLSLSHLTERGRILIGRVLSIEIRWLREKHHVVTVDKGEITRISGIFSLFAIMVDRCKRIRVFESLVRSQGRSLGPQLLTVSVCTRNRLTIRIVRLEICIHTIWSLCDVIEGHSSWNISVLLIVNLLFPRVCSCAWRALICLVPISCSTGASQWIRIGYMFDRRLIVISHRWHLRFGSS